MPKQRRPAISAAEREVLKALWDAGPSTVRDIVELLTQQGKQWSRSTVITLLQRLEKKGYVASDRSSFAFVFQAVVTREEIAEQRLKELAGELYAGEAVPLVLAFAERHRFTDDEVQQFREMIEQLECRKRKRKRKN
jgi:predicted transcriptional regulator